MPLWSILYLSFDYADKKYSPISVIGNKIEKVRCINSGELIVVYCHYMKIHLVY